MASSGCFANDRVPDDDDDVCDEEDDVDNDNEDEDVDEEQGICWNVVDDDDGCAFSFFSCSDCLAARPCISSIEDEILTGWSLPHTLPWMDIDEVKTWSPQKNRTAFQGKKSGVNEMDHPVSIRVGAEWTNENACIKDWVKWVKKRSCIHAFIHANKLINKKAFEKGELNIG